MRHISMFITFFADIALPPSEFVSVKIQSAARLVKWQRETFADLPTAPTSFDVYGADEDTSDLEPGIKKHGVTVPLSITPEGVILSGSRRLRAAKLR